MSLLIRCVKNFINDKILSLIIQDHPLNNSEYLDWSYTYRVDEGKIEPYTNFFDLNGLLSTDANFKRECVMGWDTTTSPKTPIKKDGWKFRFEWQLPNDQLVEMIWCQTFPADDPNNDNNNNPEDYESWYDSSRCPGTDCPGTGSFS